MMVLVITACPAGLRGDLTKWIMEIAPGVFVGRPTARIRDSLWERTKELCQDGKALLVYSAANEQGMEFKMHRHDWEPADYEGLTLMVRKKAGQPSSGTTTRKGWAAARYTRRRR